MTTEERPAKRRKVDISAHSASQTPQSAEPSSQALAEHRSSDTPPATPKATSDPDSLADTMDNDTGAQALLQDTYEDLQELLRGGSVESSSAKLSAFVAKLHKTPALQGTVLTVDAGMSVVVHNYSPQAAVPLATNKDASKPLTLLDLPREIRNMIYRYVVQGAELRPVETKYHSPPDPPAIMEKTVPFYLPKSSPFWEE